MRKSAAKGSFQVGQTAKALSGYRVQSLPSGTWPLKLCAGYTVVGSSRETLSRKNCISGFFSLLQGFPAELLKLYRDVPIALGWPLVDAGFAIYGGTMIRSYAAEPNFPGPEEPVPQPPQPELPPKKPSEPELPSPDPERAPFPGPGPTDPGLPQPIS